MPRRNAPQLKTVLDKDLHEAERLAANQMAAAEGVTLSNFTRRLLRKEYRKRVTNKPNQKLFADLVQGVSLSERKKQPKPTKKGVTDEQRPM